MLQYFSKFITNKIKSNKSILLLVLPFCVSISFGQHTAKKYNVLFIAVDDLRSELACYGASYMHTPNIDNLAAQGTLFKEAYCQQSICAPSRNSVLTGLRPDAINIYDLKTFFRTKLPDVVTLPQFFKNNGYRTEAVGKIYHMGHGNKDDRESWSIPSWKYKDQMNFAPITRGDTIKLESDFPEIQGSSQLPYYCSAAPESNMTDAVIADIAIERLQALKDSTFFMAVGFIKPHLPFVSPKKYWDLYDHASIKVPLQNEPKGLSDLALLTFGELRKYHGIPKRGLLDEETSRNLIHGYRAAVSMVDAQVGRLMETLRENGLDKNTIIVLWGDHGWKLGDYGNWCKASNMEMDVNAPLIISAPGYPKGLKTSSLAEFVDIYPTLCSLAGLSQPAHLQGTSLVPVLKDPAAKVNDVAISQYPRGKSLGYDNKLEYMGYTMRYENYRYTRWQKYEHPEEVVDRELYDQSNGAIVDKNLAKITKYKSLIEEFDKIMTAELSKYTKYSPSKGEK